MNNLVDSLANKLAFLALAIVVLILPFLFYTISKTSEATHISQAYSRVQVCILTTTTNARTEVDIENCYLQVEKELEISLVRYPTNNE